MPTEIRARRGGHSSFRGALRALLAPDLVKGGCSYFGAASVKKIKARLG